MPDAAALLFRVDREEPQVQCSSFGCPCSWIAENLRPLTIGPGPASRKPGTKRATVQAGGG